MPDLAPAVADQLLAYSPANAARQAGISRSRLYELIAAGKLPARKLGHRTLILRGDLERYLDSLPLKDGPDAPEAA
jgi:excisionase family DNA binding protein